MRGADLYHASIFIPMCVVVSPAFCYGFTHALLRSLKATVGKCARCALAFVVGVCRDSRCWSNVHVRPGAVTCDKTDKQVGCADLFVCLLYDIYLLLNKCLFAVDDVDTSVGDLLNTTACDVVDSVVRCLNVYIFNSCLYWNNEYEVHV